MAKARDRRRSPDSGVLSDRRSGTDRRQHERVLVDWTVELFFPKDIVQTIDLR